MGFSISFKGDENCDFYFEICEKNFIETKRILHNSSIYLFIDDTAERTDDGNEFHMFQNVSLNKNDFDSDIKE